MPQDNRNSFKVFLVCAMTWLAVYGLSRSFYAIGDWHTEAVYVKRDIAAKQTLEDNKMMEKIMRALAAREVNWPAIQTFKGLLASSDGQKNGIDKVLSFAETVKKIPAEYRAGMTMVPNWGNIMHLADGGELPLLIKLRDAKLLAPALAGEIKPLTAPEWPKPPVLKPFWDRSNRTWWIFTWALTSFVSVLVWAIWFKSNTSWGSFWVIAAIMIAAPFSFTSLLFYGAFLLIFNRRRLASAVENALTAVMTRIRALLYHLRILRQLPAPVVQPIAGLAATGPVAAPLAPSGRVPGEPSDDEPIWYVIEEDELLGRRHLLAQQNIAVYPITVQAPRTVRGIGVPAADLPRFEEVLGLDAASAENANTDVRRTVLRTYDDMDKEIRIEGFRKSKALLKRVLGAVFAHQRLAKVICVADHHWSEVAEDARSAGVTVYCYTKSHTDHLSRSFNRIFGQTARSSSLIGVSNDGSAEWREIRDQDGNVLAAVRDRQILVFWYFWENLEESWVAEVLSRILRESIAAFGSHSSKEDEERSAQEWREGIDGHRERYVQLCLSRIKGEMKELIEKKERCDQLVQEAGATITEQLRRRHRIEVRLESYESGRLEQERDHLAREFDQLAASKCVVAVRALNDRVEVDTRTVFISYEGGTYRIGRFTIILKNDGAVRFANMDRTLNGPIHPHVRSDGLPCLGNITEAVSKLMADRQYAAVTNLLFRYLESYNPSSPYYRISHWKRVANKEAA